jgi:hypothetical protein
VVAKLSGGVVGIRKKKEKSKEGYIMGVKIAGK